MDPFGELTMEMSLLTQQLRMRQKVNEHHQRVSNQMQSPQMPMCHVRYGGTQYRGNFNIGWDHHSSTSWEEKQDTSHSPHVQISSWKDTIDVLARLRDEMEESRAQMPKES